MPNHADVQVTDRQPDLPGAADVLSAHARVKEWVHQTPLLTSASIDQLCGRRVYFKCENLQRTGSYKIRGAANHILALQERLGNKLPGVVAASSGNHGQAVAYMARKLGIPATIVVPRDILSVKLSALRAYGAHIETIDGGSDDLNAASAAIARSTGYREIPPYDHALTIAGQATCLYEAVTQQLQTQLDLVLCPVGGGGLTAGTALALEATHSAARLIAVEPEGADDTYQSWKAGRRVVLDKISTVADALRSNSPGEVTFEIIRHRLHSVVTVSDQEIIAAMRLIWERLKLVVEPSGAAAFAGLLNRGLPGTGPVLVILTGGNVEFPTSQDFGTAEADSPQDPGQPRRQSDGMGQP